MLQPPLQTDIFARIADPRDLRMMFDHIPGVFFFAKDTEGRFLIANTAFCARYGLRREAELVGETDEKFVPAEVAEAYREDDRRVMRSNAPILNRLELFYDEQHYLDWFLTTKLPLHDRNGKVIGVIGMIRRDERYMKHHDVREVTAAVQFARDHRRRAATTAELAQAIHVSERQLQRKLRAALGISPSELLLRARIRSAAEDLANTPEQITEIALDHGFCDQSAFTAQFRKRTGVTPRQFRIAQQARPGKPPS